MEFVYIVLIVVLDQLAKLWAKARLYPYNDIQLIPGYLDFTYVENRGAAFGIFKDKKIFLIGVTALVIIFMIFYVIKNRDMKMFIKVSIILIIGGAIGNLIDRIYLGYVIDYIHFHIKDIFDWPVFNVADISVVCGTILLALNLLITRE